MRIEILDLGISNLDSVIHSIKDRGNDSLEIFTIKYSHESDRPKAIVIPGMGHFQSGMNQLAETGLGELLRDEAKRGTKIVGICLGMQLLCNSSEEAPDTAGLGIIDAQVRKLTVLKKIPNIGWNLCSPKKDLTKFASFGKNLDFYFSHSYFVELNDQAHELTATDVDGFSFSSALKNGNILAFQFHPEKSGLIGQELISEVLQWCADD